MSSKPQFVGEKVKLGELLLNTFSGEWGTEEGELLTPVLRTSNFNEDGSLNYSTPAMRCIPEGKVAKKRMVRGDIILEKSGGTPKRPVGIMAFYDSDALALCSNFNQVLRFDESRILPRFAFHQLRWLKDRNAFDRYTRKTTGLQNLQMKKLIELKLRVPQIEAQTSIATTLDEIVCDQRTLQQEIACLDSLVKSRFVEMFGDLDSDDSRPLKDVCSIITDGTHQPPKFVDEGIPFLFVSNIASDVVDYETNKFISAEDYEQLIRRTPIEIGDVLVSAVGSFGHPAIVRDGRPFCFQRHIAYLKPRHNLVDSDYLHAALLSDDAQRYMDRCAKGVAQRTVTLKSFKEMKIPVPSMCLQEEFAAFVSQVDKSRFAS